MNNETSKGKQIWGPVDFSTFEERLLAEYRYLYAEIESHVDERPPEEVQHRYKVISKMEELLDLLE